MNKQQQLLAVKRAFELTVKISELESKLNDINNLSSIKQPQPPVRETAKSQYPEIKSNIKFSWFIALVPIAVVLVLSGLFPILGAFLLLLSPAWIVVYYFAIYRPRNKADIEKTRNSNEYRQQCAAIDIETQRKQEELDKRYQDAMKEYKETVLPKYQKDLEEWKNQHEQKISNVQQELINTKRELTEHYEKTQILPKKYRNYDALSYINTAMTFSSTLAVAEDISVDEAIDMYEEECERKANISYNISYRSTTSDGNSDSEEHGILSGLVNSAINNSQNRGYSSAPRNRSSGRQSLWGTAMCPYGKRAKEYDPKAPDFETIRCNIGCPLWTECGGK